MASKIYFIVCALILLGSISDMAEAKYGSAEICKWLKGKTGWGCDDPASRGIWRTLNRVNNCHEFCRQRLGRQGGRCVSNRNYDASTWCPKGQTCVCY